MGLLRRKKRDVRRWLCGACKAEGTGDGRDHRCAVTSQQPGQITWSGRQDRPDIPAAIVEMADGRAPHNPLQQLIPAGDQRTASELVADAGDNVPSLASAMGVIAGRFEMFVKNIHALNQGLQEFKRDVMVPFKEELKYLRYTTGDRLNHASSDLEKYVAKLDQVLWAALRAQGMSDDAIRQFRETNGMQPETPRGFELELHLREVEELKEAVRTLTIQNQRLLAQLDTRHKFQDGEDGWVYHAGCQCAQCNHIDEHGRAMEAEVSRVP